MIDAVYANYRAVLAAEADLAPEQWTFKSNAIYRQILEHVTFGQGQAYLSLAARHKRWNDEFRTTVANVAVENDRLGRPEQYWFEDLGVKCSPTNMRYLWHALSILDHVDALNISVPSFIEIGGGYGGLALWMHRLTDQPFTYCILDLEEAAAIQRAYTTEHQLPVTVCDISQVEQAHFEDEFLISAYGFSEFSPDVRRWYEAKVIPGCSHGWLLWNMIPVYRFTDAPLTVEDERPLTGVGNVVVRF